MRPIVLTMQAFGPYAEVETVDFRELGSRTMFVISGKTGAGKTTIFDGISFAIYGKTSGEERSGTDLRSHYADDALPTEVTLHFLLKGTEYSITRSPQQEKKKTKGDGVTVVSSKAELFEMKDGEKVLLAGSVRDVDEKIRELIQLDFQQFRQILMIPQGEFRKLLTSDSKDKELILQRLFRTERFRALQDELKIRSAAMKKQVGQSIEDRHKLLGSIDPLDHEPLREALLADPVHEERVIELAENVVATQKEKSHKAEKTIIRRQKERDRLLQEIERATYIKDAFEQLATLEAEWKESTEQLPQIEALKKRIAKAEEAEPLAVLLQQKQDAVHAVEQRQQTVTGERSRLVGLEQEKIRVDEQKVRADEKTVQLDEWKLKRNEMEAARKQIRQRNELQSELQSIAQSGKKTKHDRETAEQELEAAKLEIRRLEEQISARSDKRNELDELKEQRFEHASALQLMEQGTRLAAQEQELTRTFTQQQDQRKQAEQAHTAAAAALEEAERKVRANLAVRLASHLHEGEACPVCGSAEHPSPARHAEEADEQSVQQYAAAERSAAASLEQIKARIEAAVREQEAKRHDKEELTGKLSAFDPSFRWEELSERFRQLNATSKERDRKIAELTQTVAELPALQTKRTQWMQRSEQLEQTVKEKQQAVEAMREQYTRVKATLDQLNSQIPADWSDEAAFYEAQKALEDRIRTTAAEIEAAALAVKKADEQVSVAKTRLQSLQSELEREEKAAADQTARAQEALAASSFATEADVSDARMTRGELGQNQQDVTRFDQQRYVIKERKEALAGQLDGKAIPDLAQLQEQTATVDAALKEEQDSKNALDQYIVRHEAILTSVKANADETKKLEEQYALIGHLSGMANGDNHLKFTFERYVLAFFLEDILHVANERLGKMTSGRYRLVRKEDRSKGNVQSGLELLVFDQYTGQQRHVKTLSGGEAFKASLSLALGLADVVQAHAGGVSLETMFIDEGFGTLDPESLDQAIESLMDIQQSGRLVGVISHVPELKERIDARLEVHSSQQGSTTEFVFTA